MMLYRKEKVKVCSLDGDGLLRHSCWSSERIYISTIHVYNLPRLRTHSVGRSDKRKLFFTKNVRRRQYPTKTIMDADNITLLSNAHTQSCILVAYPGAGIRSHRNLPERKRSGELVSNEKESSVL